MNFIQRCLELASHGAGNVAPNPMVGAVIVHNGLIIGEGFHRRYGEAHAEVNAIASVKDESLLKESTLYVNLEPCSHYGKTPPCAQLIIEKQIPRVVIACEDPFEAVAGRGVKMLREAGIEVVTGVMESEAKALNKYFITAHTKRRPYIILKWAESADGFVDKIRNDRSEPPVKLSSTLTRMLVHKLRSDVQAIMVGTNTAILDNPSLKVSHWVGKSPVRIVFDRYGRIPHDSKLFDGTAETIVIGATDG
ncbi:MAG: bifunctional diaminohydroxyphosphoribosylaminopyrimidine deaminase/5-amino-6-(5-phosphoribosylamino)uracil reductase RibD, partial [Tannerella sp.]|nr:bifunctional diaminohydroxyphosphoribosylaminopyrimidine deaminase/5-amino-6-(5-phosphoribosylamino)uracil reductase RibD [Tannerella sp.]